MRFTDDVRREIREYPTRTLWRHLIKSQEINFDMDKGEALNSSNIEMYSLKWTLEKNKKYTFL
jgi:hypothetical protein